MKYVKVSTLKAHLSEYLAKVRRGETVIISDRDTPIARLVPYDPEVENFRIERPVSKRRGGLRRVKGVRPLKKVDVVALLREDRDAR